MTTPRKKTGPRSAIGTFDAALGNLLATRGQLQRATDGDSNLDYFALYADVARQRRALRERVRKMLRAVERKNG